MVAVQAGGADGTTGDYLAQSNRNSVTAMGFHLMRKETERGLEQADDISTLLPSLVSYRGKMSMAGLMLRQRLKQISLNALQKESALSRHTILRA